MAMRIFNHKGHKGFHKGHKGNDALQYFVSIVKTIVSIVVKNGMGFNCIN